MIILFCAAAYLLGAVPTGYIITKLVKGVDIRTCGSGNPGATNVYRTVGAAAGITTFVLDALKGFLPVLLAIKYFGGAQAAFWILTGVCAICGHMWTVFLKFRGGKGVATAAGVFFALLPAGTLIALVLFFIILFITRYVSAGSITAAVFIPIYSLISRAPAIISFFAAIVGIAIIIKHKTNIQRLIAGTENKFKSTGAKSNE
jgi:glycerol-3-phosphate acyltransferase PlsY